LEFTTAYHTFAAQIHLLGRDEVFILNQSDSISWEEMNPETTV